MAYYFMMEEKKGKYEIIDITRSILFTKLSNYRSVGACSLQEIDIFTTYFFDIEELKKDLLKENIINIEDISKTLSIRISRNGKYEKVMYDMLFQKDIEYIINPEKIIKYLEKELRNNNFDLIEKLANNFLNYHDCMSTAPEVREFASASKRNNQRSIHFDEFDQNRDLPLRRMLKLLIYKHNELPNGYINYKNEVNYRHLHDIIAFVNNYNKKMELLLEKNSSITNSDNFECEQISIFNNNVKEEQPVKLQGKTKKRELKREYIEGQISMF